MPGECDGIVRRRYAHRTGRRARGPVRCASVRPIGIVPPCHGPRIATRGRALDATGSFPLPPSMRVVSLVPSLTETLVDLGVEVVGVTRFCVHPPSIRRTARVVGGTKTVDVDAVRALRPDLVVANREENVRAQVEAIAAHAPVVVTDVATLDDALATIRTLGARTGTTDAADALASSLARGFDGLTVPPGADAVRAAYFIWKDPWMAAGGDTFVHDVLRRGGLVNVFADRLRYPEVTPEDVAAAAPAVLLFSSEPFRFRPKHVGAMTAACPGAAVRFVDGEAFSWYGSRLRITPGILRALRADLLGAP